MCWLIDVCLVPFYKNLKYWRPHACLLMTSAPVPVGIIPAGSLKVVDIYLNELCNITMKHHIDVCNIYRVVSYKCNYVIFI